MDVRIIADADDYFVLDKPAGVLAHPTARGEAGTLAQWIKERYPGVAKVGEDEMRPGMMHRLDKEASGVMVIAKTPAMFDHLKAQFQRREVVKEYLVLVHGKLPADHGMIDFAIDRGAKGRMAARPKIDLTRVKNVGKEQPGREARTEFTVEKRFARFTLLRVQTHTGRTHQIRVHMLAYGHPVVGDDLYFNRKLNRKKDQELGRLFLHAEKICFKDLAVERVCYEAPLPVGLAEFLQTIK